MSAFGVDEPVLSAISKALPASVKVFRSLGANASGSIKGELKAGRAVGAKNSGKVNAAWNAAGTGKPRSILRRSA